MMEPKLDRPLAKPKESAYHRVRASFSVLFRRSSAKIGIITLIGIIVFVLVGQAINHYSPNAVTGPINHPPQLLPSWKSSCVL